MATVVEQYLDSKKLDYRLDGENAMMQCPFCEQGDKFGININNWFYQCFRGSCAVKGNEITFKRKFGDSVHVSNFEDEVAQVVEKKAPTKETLPDIDAAHAKLLEDDELVNWLNDERGFSLETLRKFRIGLGKRKFGDVVARALMFPYFKGNQCVGVKYKSLPPAPKDFRFSAGWDLGLYNENCIVKDMDYLILCEGETDVMALIGAGYTNVVGVPGAHIKKADWAELLNLPKKLYLVMDNDEVGIDGAKKFVTRFGVDRINVVNIPHFDLDVPIIDKHGVARTTISDPNEFFTNGHTKEEFDKLLEAARPQDIEGVTSMDDAFDSLIRMYGTAGTFAPEYLFKWPSLNVIAKGIKKGDLIVFLAAAKCGKTTWCLNQCEFMAATYGLTPHFDCMEMDGEDLTKKWAAMVLDKVEDDLTIEQIKEAKALSRSRPNQFIFTRSRPTSLEEYLNHLRRIKARYDSGVIVIDNFQILVDLTIGRNNSNNRPAYMSQVSKTIKALAHELRTPVILISQPKQLQEGKSVGVNDSEGSSTLTKDADLFFLGNRNPEIKMTTAQMDSIGKLETNQSHSDTMYIELGLSRRSAGGLRTYKIEGSKSIIREFDTSESAAGEVRKMIGNMKYTDASEELTAA